MNTQKIFTIKKEKIRLQEDKDTFCLLFFDGNVKYTSETYKISEYKGNKKGMEKILRKFKQEIKKSSNFVKLWENEEEAKHVARTTLEMLRLFNEDK